MNCRVVIWGSLAALGVLLITGGVTLTQIGDDLVEDILHGKLSLFDEESDGYKYFVSWRGIDEGLEFSLCVAVLDHSAGSGSGQLHIL